MMSMLREIGENRALPPVAWNSLGQSVIKVHMEVHVEATTQQIHFSSLKSSAGVITISDLKKHIVTQTDTKVDTQSNGRE